MIRLRFVTCNDPLSAMIRLQAGICMPFTPSHVEAVAQDGKGYIGEHFDGGMQERPVGYDAAGLMALPSGKKSEAFVSLQVSGEMEALFYSFVEKKIGEPYDWKSILSFIDPAWNLHEVNDLLGDDDGGVARLRIFQRLADRSLSPHLAARPVSHSVQSRRNRSLGGSP